MNTLFCPEWTRDPNATQIEVKAILAKHRESSEANKNPDQEHAHIAGCWMVLLYPPTKNELKQAKGSQGMGGRQGKFGTT